jgi:hypothetical protein
MKLNSDQLNWLLLTIFDSIFEGPVECSNMIVIIDHHCQHLWRSIIVWVRCSKSERVGRSKRFSLEETWKMNPNSDRLIWLLMTIIGSISEGPVKCSKRGRVGRSKRFSLEETWKMNPNSDRLIWLLMTIIGSISEGPVKCSKRGRVGRDLKIKPNSDWLNWSFLSASLKVHDNLCDVFEKMESWKIKKIYPGRDLKMKPNSYRLNRLVWTSLATSQKSQ